jgi:hypothetical protein
MVGGGGGGGRGGSGGSGGWRGGGGGGSGGGRHSLALYLEWKQRRQRTRSRHSAARWSLTRHLKQRPSMAQWKARRAAEGCRLECTPLWRISGGSRRASCLGGWSRSRLARFSRRPASVKPSSWVAVSSRRGVLALLCWVDAHSAVQGRGSASARRRYGGSRLCAHPAVEDLHIECLYLQGATRWSECRAAGPVGRGQQPHLTTSA